MNLEKNYTKNSEPVGKLQNPLVMLVDDSEIDNFVNDKMLRRYEFSNRITSYEHGTAALEYLANPQNEMPAYIFLDLHMPDMDGIDFVEKLNALSPARKCEVVILSNSLDPKLRAQITSQSNVVAYFSKPLIKSNVDQLLGRVSDFQAA